MGKSIRFVGPDVHAETIAVAVAVGRDEVRSLGIIPNRPEAVRRLLGKLGDFGTLKVCYEAGPTGYALYWQLTKLGLHCDVIAPSRVPSAARSVHRHRVLGPNERGFEKPSCREHREALGDRHV